MNESERVLDLYIKQQQERMNELSQQVLLLSTKNEYLNEKLQQTELELKQLKDINRKETNAVEKFKYTPEVQNRKERTYEARKEVKTEVKTRKKQHNFKHEQQTVR